MTGKCRWNAMQYLSFCRTVDTGQCPYRCRRQSKQHKCGSTDECEEYAGQNTWATQELKKENGD